MNSRVVARAEGSAGGLRRGWPPLWGDHQACSPAGGRARAKRGWSAPESSPLQGPPREDEASFVQKAAAGIIPYRGRDG